MATIYDTAFYPWLFQVFLWALSYLLYYHSIFNSWESANDFLFILDRQKYINVYMFYMVLLYLMIKSWTVIGRCSMFYKR